MNFWSKCTKEKRKIEVRFKPHFIINIRDFNAKTVEIFYFYGFLIVVFYVFFDIESSQILEK